jgi:hypothetical protein
MPQTRTSSALYDINGHVKPDWLAARHWARFARARLERCDSHTSERVDDVLDSLAIDAGWLLGNGHHRKFKGDPALAWENLSEIASGTAVYDDAVIWLDELADAAQPNREAR